MARRKPRSAKTYRRRGEVREPYDVVLIVCEGKKTEPTYFEGLKRAYRMSGANITVVPGDGNDPVSIVKHAIAEYEKDIYDLVFCVFDRDGHANYQQALDMIAKSASGKNGKLQGITSVPCFEIWVLLHFAYSTAPYMKTGNKSGCDKVIDAVRVHLPEYEKALTGVFERLEPHTNRAVTHADRLARHNRDTGSDNPATKVHELVTYLRGLKQ
ncbi:MAG: hypothetical protein A3F74_19835 [Betaproteobacteria bacterium RIFCSPLOWO2_12_FULL_62_58]|nr:MAG: hypothetical protein A3F74_19835 [Betaproteobacteria bacterium RIFCSPLOWO2_12_FULL_62_58]